MGKVEYDNLVRENAETVRRVIKLENIQTDDHKEIIKMKLDINSLKIRVGIYSAVGAIIGGGLMSIIIALVISAFKLKL